VLNTLYASSLPKSAPVATPAPATVSIDPWTLAGIGRRASRQELIEMGALAVPPERL